MLYNLKFYDGSSIVVNRVMSKHNWKLTPVDVQTRWMDSDEFSIFCAMLGMVRMTKEDIITSDQPLFKFEQI